jgi:hypothetical protein
LDERHIRVELIRIADALDVGRVEWDW